jgi:hypothetical protein
MIWGFETTSSNIERLPKSESARFKIALKKKEGISHFGNALLFCLNSQLLFFFRTHLKNVDQGPGLPSWRDFTP